jgi:hypothetical protein
MNAKSIIPFFKSLDRKLVIAVLFIIIVWGANWLLVDMFLCYAEGGQFGDRFGATTSLFGGITIVFLLYTIYDQRNVNKESKISFTNEMKQLKKQVRIQSYQRFENTFFHHIKLHHTILENMADPDKLSITLAAYTYNVTRGIAHQDDYGHL